MIANHAHRAGLFAFLLSATAGCAVEAAADGTGPYEEPPEVVQDQAMVLQEMVLGDLTDIAALGPDEAQLARTRRPPKAVQAFPALSASVAELGRPAPDFALTDQTGRTVRLSDFRGRAVVLEWFDPDCPYVKRSHEKGALKDCGNSLVRAGVVWLAINSVPRDRSGSRLDRNLEALQEWSLAYPVLFDESGEVARAWRVSATPHLFVVDPEGVLVYEGAIDNAQEAERDRPVNYVVQALSELTSGKVSRPRTKPYGCRLP